MGVLWVYCSGKVTYGGCGAVYVGLVWLRWVSGGFFALNLLAYGFGDYGFGGCVCLVV